LNIKLFESVQYCFFQERKGLRESLFFFTERTALVRIFTTMFIDFYRPLDQVPKCWEEDDSIRILDSLPEGDLDVWFLRLEESLQACGIPQEQWPSVATALLAGEPKRRMERFIEKRAPIRLDIAHQWEELKHHAANVGAKFEHESGEVINKISGEPNIFVSLLS
jgi:hypothetical protein